jgi:hypothetical protein
LSPGGSTHLHTDSTQTTQITTEIKQQLMWESAGRAPSLRVFCPGICLTTEGKARKNHIQGKRNFSQVNKNLSQSTVYILPRYPHITKPTQTHTLRNPHTHTHTYTHTLQNNIKPPQYNLKQTQYKIYPNEIQHHPIWNSSGCYLLGPYGH